MTEEGTNLRLAQLEKDTMSIKTDLKDASDKIIDIEKGNIRIETVLKQISDTYNIIKYLFLAFIVSNIGMFLISKIYK